jgi:hypothetical protein
MVFSLVKHRQETRLPVFSPAKVGEQYFISSSSSETVSSCACSLKVASESLRLWLGALLIILCGTVRFLFDG